MPVNYFLQENIQNASWQQSLLWTNQLYLRIFLSLKLVFWLAVSVLLSTYSLERADLHSPNYTTFPDSPTLLRGMGNFSTIAGIPFHFPLPYTTSDTLHADRH